MYIPTMTFKGVIFDQVSQGYFKGWPEALKIHWFDWLADQENYPTLLWLATRPPTFGVPEWTIQMWIDNWNHQSTMRKQFMAILAKVPSIAEEKIQNPCALVISG